MVVRRSVDGLWWGGRRDVSVLFVEFLVCRHCTYQRIRTGVHCMEDTRGSSKNNS